MKYRVSHIKLRYLLLASIFVFGAVLVLNFGLRKTSLPFYQQQLDAAKLMQRCMDRLASAIEIDLPESGTINDPNRTGLIGIEYSPMTTTLGDLSAKRSATNPDFAALLVRWFHKMKLIPGDVIAVGCSGSFPGLILATICAAETMQLRPALISSVTASSYGANRPEWTWLDMEHYLNEIGLIHTRSNAASLGGARDVALEFDPEIKKLLYQTIERNNIPLIYEEDRALNVQKRAGIYEQYDVPKIFINIGGAQINVGDYALEQRLSPGLNQIRLKSSKAPRSMTEYFAGQQVPLIHLLHIDNILIENKLPVDPIPLSIPGKSAVYYRDSLTGAYKLLSILMVALAVIIIIVGKRQESSKLVV